MKDLAPEGQVLEASALHRTNYDGDTTDYESFENRL